MTAGRKRSRLTRLLSKGASSDAPFFYQVSTHAPRLSTQWYSRFWGTHAAKYQGQFTRLDCQDHHRPYRRVDGVDRLRSHFPGRHP
ncbi:protein of unknown function [Pseudomonas sp. JV551A1]|nr:protein of unknown function [Pseudomonas sp. JV551A1]